MQRIFFFAVLALFAPLIIFAPVVSAATICPINNQCCTQQLQQCQSNGRDANCPTDYQWCYSGYCVNENYNPSTNTCPDLKPTPSPLGSCPVNNSCCSVNLQKCSANGRDTNCPQGYQWCYSGYCVDEKYNPATNSCLNIAPTPAPTNTPSPVPSLTPLPTHIPSPSVSSLPSKTPLPTLKPLPTSPPASTPVANQPDGCPISGRITTPYGYNIIGYSGNNAGCVGLARCHNGIDIAAVQGTPIISSLDGMVTASTWDAYKGNYISITNISSNITAIYEHLNALSHLKIGNVVKKGNVIGYIGKTGLGVTGSHLHYKLMQGSNLLNPFRFVRISDADPLLKMTFDSLLSNNYGNLYPLGRGHTPANWGQCIK